MSNIPVTGPGERGSRPRTPEEIEADKQRLRDAARVTYGTSNSEWQQVSDAANANAGNRQGNTGSAGATGPRTSTGGPPLGSTNTGAPATNTSGIKFTGPDASKFNQTQEQKNAETRIAAKSALKQLMAPIEEDPNARIAKERQLKAQAGQARLQAKGQYSRAGMGSSGAAGYGQALSAQQAASGIGSGMEDFDRTRRLESQQRQLTAAGLTPVVGRLGQEQVAYERALQELRQQKIDLAGDVGDTVQFSSPGGNAYATIVDHAPQAETAKPQGETTKDGKKYQIWKTNEGDYIAVRID